MSLAVVANFFGNKSYLAAILMFWSLFDSDFYI